MATIDPKAVHALARAIQEEIPRLPRPPQEGSRPETDQVIAMSLVRGTRGYIEKIVDQINGSYERGWFDACAVMARRLMETLIIEAFEKHGIADSIKNANGDFLQLRDLVDEALGEPSWNLGRNTKRALPRLRDAGNQSAHSRRFIAHRGDIDKLVPDLRVAVQELIFLARLK
jgi:hypothetical protein